MKRMVLYCSIMVSTLIAREFVETEGQWEYALEYKSRLSSAFTIALVLAIAEVICNLVIKYTNKPDEKDEQNPMYIVLMATTAFGLILLGIRWIFDDSLPVAYFTIQSILNCAIVLVPLIFGIVWIIIRKRHKTNKEA